MLALNWSAVILLCLEYDNCGLQCGQMLLICSVYFVSSWWQNHETDGFDIAIISFQQFPTKTVSCCIWMNLFVLLHSAPKYHTDRQNQLHGQEKNKLGPCDSSTYETFQRLYCSVKIPPKHNLTAPQATVSHVLFLTKQVAQLWRY